MGSKEKQKTYIYILGAGASVSAGLPVAAQIPNSMIDLSKREDVSCCEKKILEIVSKEICERKAKTVDEIAGHIFKFYDNRTLYFPLFYMAQWATCVLLRWLQRGASNKVRSYENLFEHIENHLKSNKKVHILSFNYDSVLKMAYKKRYGEYRHWDDPKISVIEGGECGFSSEAVHYYQVHGSVDFIVPISSKENKFKILPLTDEGMKNECDLILNYYNNSLGDGRREASASSMPAVPMIIFPTHLELFRIAPEITRVLKEQIEQKRKQYLSAIDNAEGAMAIGYSFPDADIDEWKPVVSALMKRKIALQVQAGESSGDIVKKLMATVDVPSKAGNLLLPIYKDF